MHDFEQQIALLGCAVALRVVILHGNFPGDGGVDDKMPFMVCPVTLGTNLVESSVTLPDVAIVIDLGLRRHVIEDTLEGRKELADLWTSRSSATQRAGRAGRTQPGMVLRLYSNATFGRMPEHINPPLGEAQLAGVYLLSLQTLQSVGQPADLRRVHKDICETDISGIQRALVRFGALGPKGTVTNLGSFLASLPVELRLGKLVAIGLALRCPCEAVCMAAALSVPGIFYWPNDFENDDRSERPMVLARLSDNMAALDNEAFSDPIRLVRGMAQALGGGRD